MYKKTYQHTAQDRKERYNRRAAMADDLSNLPHDKQDNMEQTTVTTNNNGHEPGQQSTTIDPELQLLDKLLARAGDILSIDNPSTGIMKSIDNLIIELCTCFPSAMPERYSEARRQAITSLNNIQHQSATASTVSGSSSPASGSTTTATPMNIHRKLPTSKDLEPFDGMPARWSTFRGLFEEVILGNNMGSDLLKRNILATLVPRHKNLILSQPNCTDALDKVALCYSGPEVLWSDMLRIINEVPVMKANSTAVEWEKLQDAILTAQENIDPTDAAWRQQAQVLLKSKLAQPVWKDYNFRVQTETLDTLLKVVQEQIFGLRKQEAQKTILGSTTTAAESQPSSKPASRSWSHSNSNKHTKPSTAPIAVTATTFTGHKRFYEPCRICSGDHMRRDCNLTRPQRRQAIEKAGKCVTCLFPKETNHRCRGSGCNCGSQVHALLCPCQSYPPSTPSVPSVPRPPPPPPPSSGGFGNSSQTNHRFTQQASSSSAQSGSNGNSHGSTNVISLAGLVSTSIEEARPLKRKRDTELTTTTYLPTLRLRVWNPESRVSTVARTLLDSASTASFISEALVDELCVDKQSITPMVVSAFGGLASLHIKYEAKLKLQSLNEPNVTSEVRVFVMSGIIVGHLPAAAPAYIKEAKRLGIELTDFTTKDTYVPVDLLIGQDLYNDHFLLPLQHNHRFAAGMAFVNSRFGWTLQGIPGGKQPRNMFVNCAFLSTGPEPNQSLVKFPAFSERKCICEDLTRLFLDPWADHRLTSSVRDIWRQEYEQRIHYDEEIQRYLVPLPFYSDARPSNNWEPSVAQAFALHKRLSRTGCLEDYDKLLWDMVESGHARVLNKYDKLEGYYLPHFPVLKLSSITTPSRIVFNASASVQGERSLNDCIFKGVWEQTQLVNVLLRWRFHPLVVLADIRKAFLQIRIDPEHCRFLRFVWFKEGKVVVFEMTSLLFGASASPYILYAVLKRLFESHGPDVLHILEDTFMDDSALMAKTMTELKTLLARVKKVMSHGSFELHKFITLPHIAKELELEPKEGQAACLGVSWDLDQDLIRFNSPHLTTGKVTRRSLSSDFGKAFDPMGLLGPHHTRTKQLMRKVITQNKDWDESVSSDLALEAQTILSDLSYLPDIALPRIICHSTNAEYWVFGDASTTAYGVAFYVFDCDSQKAHLLLSRSHISPQDKTIPQLELVAAVLLAETYDLVRKSYPQSINRVRLFTDSQVTWHRIRSNPSKHEAYVASRVARIRLLTSADDWFYIPSDLNPADVVSRGTSLRLLRANTLWFNGPPLSAILQTEEATRALDTHSANTLHEVAPVNGHAIMEAMVSDMPFGILRWFVSRMVSKMSSYVHLTQRYTRESGQEVSLHELCGITLWKNIQAVLFKEELPAIHSSGQVPATSPLARIPLRLDEHGLLRLDSRLKNAQLPNDIKFPLVLIDSKVARNYIDYVHVNHAHHSGAATTEYYVSQFIYLPNCARIVQDQVHNCITCRRFRTGRPFSIKMGPLPKGRVVRGYAFEVIGMDISGAIHNEFGRLTKYYFLIFVCLKARAIHVELIDSREATAIMLAYRRFVGLYGTPREVHSDNEKGFEKLNKTNSDIYRRYCEATKKLSSKISPTQWLFNAPGAPWKGGSWERLIGTFKQAIDRARLNCVDSYDELQTVLREAQRFVNSRPLWHSHNGQVITPAHLLFGRPLESHCPIRFEKAPKDDVLLMCSRLQHDLDRIWTLWSQEYLLTLRHYKWLPTEDAISKELIIVKDDRSPRYHWPLGYIKRIKSRQANGSPSLVDVTLLDGTELTRSVRSIIPIERSLRGEDVVSLERTTKNTSSTNTPQLLPSTSNDTTTTSTVTGGVTNDASIG